MRQYVAKTELGDFTFETDSINEYLIKENLIEQIAERVGDFPRFIQIEEANKFSFMDKIKRAYNSVAPNSLPMFEDDPIADRQFETKVAYGKRAGKVAHRIANKYNNELDDNRLIDMAQKALVGITANGQAREGALRSAAHKIASTIMRNHNGDIQGSSKNVEKYGYYTSTVASICNTLLGEMILKRLDNLFFYDDYFEHFSLREPGMF